MENLADTLETQQPKPQHTATPWKIVMPKGQDLTCWIDTTIDCGRKRVANCDISHSPDYLANAAFIVRAANAHEELLGMLRENLDAWLGEEDSVKYEHHALIVRLHTIIAKAEGK